MTKELRRELAGLAHGDHLCLSHETVAEQIATAVIFLGDGIDRGELSLLVGSPDRADEVSAALRAAGTDVKSECRRGALRTVTSLDIARFTSGEFDPHTMVAFLRRMEAEALADGFGGLRVAGDMSWAMGLEVPPERLIEFEVCLDQSLRNSRSIVICQYDRSRFAPAVIYEVLRAHPLVVLGEQVCPNPYYEPPELLLSHAQDSAEFKAKRVEWWIALLKRARADEQERERAVEALRVSEDRFRRAFAEAAIGMALMSPTGRFLEVNAAYRTMTGYSEAEILATGFESMTHAEDLPAYSQLIQRMLGPDVLVLDLMMPGLAGLDALPVIRQRSPQTRVVVLSMYSNSAFIAAALRDGATAYVLKGSEEENLVHAVREAAAGRRYLSPPVTERAIDAYINQTRSAAFDAHETLTVREREVLQLAAEGKTGTEIAARLHVSPRTVENHRANLMRKLGLKNQSELVRYALRRGIIPLEE